jgi:hypothetical protein
VVNLGRAKRGHRGAVAWGSGDGWRQILRFAQDDSCGFTIGAVVRGQAATRGRPYMPFILSTAAAYCSTIVEEDVADGADGGDHAGDLADWVPASRAPSEPGACSAMR